MSWPTDTPDEMERVKTDDHYDTLLLWCDLETTGLDPEKCELIEGHFIVTPAPSYRIDGEVLKELGSFHCFFRTSDLVKWEMSALDMHTKSGLITAHQDHLDKYLGIDPSCQDETNRGDLYYFVHKASVRCDNLILAARNPGFERKFIKAWMPGIERKLHYRMFDVTTLKMTGLLNKDPEDLSEGIDGHPHRAKHDITRDLAWCRKFIANQLAGA